MHDFYQKDEIDAIETDAAGFSVFSFTMPAEFPFGPYEFKPLGGFSKICKHVKTQKIKIKK